MAIRSSFFCTRNSFYPGTIRSLERVFSMQANLQNALRQTTFEIDSNLF
jgi:hypothetical protein